MEEKYIAYLANLDCKASVYSVDFHTGKMTIRVSDIPVSLAVLKSAGIGGKYVTYWFGKNAGGNKLIERATGLEVGDDEKIGEAKADLNPFEYQKPNEAMVAQITEVREGCKALYEVLLKLPMSRERSLAITKLEEVSMWANKGIVFS